MSKQDRDKGDMTVREAGRRGGDARKDESGHQGYQEFGRNGGQRVGDPADEGRQSGRKNH